MYVDPSGHIAILTLILCGLALVGMGLTIGGVATDNNLMTAIGLTMVAVPALISGGMALGCFGAWGTMAIGAGTIVTGIGTGLFASAEYQEAFTGNNWMLDAGMSEGWYNGLMLTTASLATAGTAFSLAGVGQYRLAGSSWQNGWKSMRSHYYKHGMGEMGYKNIYQYTNAAKNVIENGTYVVQKNAYALYLGGKQCMFVGVGRGTSLITTFSYRTFTIKKLIELGILVI